MVPAIASPRSLVVTAEILDGKALAASIRHDVTADVRQFTEQSGVVPSLTVVLVGDDPASRVYVRNKQTACQAVGINGTVLRFPSNVSQAALLETVDLLNSDRANHGILVQLPLPSGVDDRLVLERIDPRKDVDGFHPDNVGLLGFRLSPLHPLHALGDSRIARRGGDRDAGARAVVLGRSQTVGKPMALLLLQKGLGGDATVTVAHTATREVAALCREADILIAAVGQPEYVRGDWIKPARSSLTSAFTSAPTARCAETYAFTSRSPSPRGSRRCRAASAR